MPGLTLSILQLTIREVEFSPLQPRSSSKGYKTSLFQEITGFLQHRLSFAKMAFEHSCLRLVHQGVREVMVMSLELAEKGYCLGSKFIRLAGTIEADQAGRFVVRLPQPGGEGSAAGRWCGSGRRGVVPCCNGPVPRKFRRCSVPHAPLKLLARHTWQRWHEPVRAT